MNLLWHHVVITCSLINGPSVPPWGSPTIIRYRCSWLRSSLSSPCLTRPLWPGTSGLNYPAIHHALPLSPTVSLHNRPALHHRDNLDMLTPLTACLLTYRHNKHYIIEKPSNNKHFRVVLLDRLLNYSIHSACHAYLCMPDRLDNYLIHWAHVCVG